LAASAANVRRIGAQSSTAVRRKPAGLQFHLVAEGITALMFFVRRRDRKAGSAPEVMAVASSTTKAVERRQKTDREPVRLAVRWRQ